MRGKPEVTVRTYPKARITPAGAGKTGSNRANIPKSPDHPRRCGENLSLLVCLCNLLGSPPQVRGKLYVGVVCVGDWGITPAGAGKTTYRSHLRGCGKDHPRRCGENDNQNPITPEQNGSPPQVRGKLGGAYVRRTSTRITPAGAGKTKRLSPQPA